MIVLGLMSGTSLDGSIELALLNTDGDERTELLLAHTYVYENNSEERTPLFLLLKACEVALRKCDGNFSEAGRILVEELQQLAPRLFKDRELSGKMAQNSLGLLEQSSVNSAQDYINEVARLVTKLHIDAIRDFFKAHAFDCSKIDLIGFHGQTVLHWPQKKLSIQLADPKLMAKELGIPVVSRFRQADIENGGQGAPLAPIYHFAKALSSNLGECMVLNLGGCANITIVGDKPEDLIAFDTGPGCILVDRLVAQRTGNKADWGGAYGLKGNVSQPILELLFDRSVLVENTNYFSMAIPKSLDANDCKLIQELDSLSIEDACATLEAFTAATVHDAIAVARKYLNKIPSKLIVCGGGAFNLKILAELRSRCEILMGSGFSLLTADEIGWNNKSIEAELMAYLAARFKADLPITFKMTTGAPKPLKGGELF